MTEPIVIRKGTSPVMVGAGGGIITTIVHSSTVNSINCGTCTVEVAPGNSAHRWHNHVRDDAPQGEIIYPEGYEEYYYIISGRGTIQWRLPNGTTKEEAVGEGDTVFFPIGVDEHQLLNTGDTSLFLFAGASPPTRRSWQ